MAGSHNAFIRFGNEVIHYLPVKKSKIVLDLRNFAFFRRRTIKKCLKKCFDACQLWIIEFVELLKEEDLEQIKKIHERGLK